MGQAVKVNAVLIFFHTRNHAAPPFKNLQFDSYLIKQKEENKQLNSMYLSRLHLYFLNG